jgi:hypothetical protein
MPDELPFSASGVPGLCKSFAHWLIAACQLSASVARTALLPVTDRMDHLRQLNSQRERSQARTVEEVLSLRRVNEELGIHTRLGRQGVEKSGDRQTCRDSLNTNPSSPPSAAFGYQTLTPDFDRSEVISSQFYFLLAEDEDLVVSCV